MSVNLKFKIQSSADSKFVKLIRNLKFRGGNGFRN